MFLLKKTMTFDDIVVSNFENIKEIKELKFHKNISYVINLTMILIIIVTMMSIAYVCNKMYNCNEMYNKKYNVKDNSKCQETFFSNRGGVTYASSSTNQPIIATSAISTYNNQLMTTPSQIGQVIEPTIATSAITTYSKQLMTTPTQVGQLIEPKMATSAEREYIGRAPLNDRRPVIRY